MPDFMKLYLEFWAPLVEDEAGIIDKTQLAKELYDYYYLIAKSQSIIPYVTGGACSAQSDLDSIKMEADIFYAKLYLGEGAQEIVAKYEATKPTIH